MHKWLKEGKQTIITKDIKKLSNTFKGKGLGYLKEILIWYKDNLQIKKENIHIYDPNFFTRSAEQIIKSKYLIAGCADEVIFFVTLARAKKIPASYIQTIHKESIAGKRIILHGHVFSRVFLKNKTYLVNPAKDIISDKEDFGEYEPICEGLDSIDTGIKNLKDLKNSYLKYKKDINNKQYKIVK